MAAGDNSVGSTPKSVAQASEALARAVVEHETQVNAQFFGDKEIALPVELDHDQHLALVREFVDQQFTARGLIADWVLHTPTKDQPNPHIHLMHTIRELTPDGFGRKCIPVLDDAGQVQRLNGKIVYQRFLENPAGLGSLHESALIVRGVYHPKTVNCLEAAESKCES